MLDLKSKLKGVVLVVGGIALLVYSLIFLGGANPFLQLCFIVTSIGGIGQGFSVLGVNKLAIPFNILTILGTLFIIYRLVLIFLGWFA